MIPSYRTVFHLDCISVNVLVVVLAIVLQISTYRYCTMVCLGTWGFFVFLITACESKFSFKKFLKGRGIEVKSLIHQEGIKIGTSVYQMI